MPSGICLLTWGQRIAGCGRQHERVEDHTEPRRPGDSNSVHTSHWPPWATAGGFPRQGRESVWWGQAAPAASNLPVWRSVTGGREVEVNAGTISVCHCFFHCLPLSRGCDHQETSIFIWSNEVQQTNPVSSPYFVLLWKDKGSTMKTQTDGINTAPSYVTQSYSQP